MIMCVMYYPANHLFHFTFHITYNPFHFSPQFVHDLKNGSTKSDNRMDDSEVPTESSREHLDSKVLLSVMVLVVVMV